MYQFPIGAMLGSFRLPFREAVEKAASLGIQGLQISMTSGDMAPEALTPEKVKELNDIVKSNGLVVSAVCGDFGFGFSNEEKNPELISRSMKVMELTQYFETNIVTTHIGTVPADKTEPRYAVMQAACKQLADFADSMKSHFAVETGPETAVILRDFLDSLNSRGVSVNLDPANLVMVAGDDPVQAVYTLKDYIVHTHAKDGFKLANVDPTKIYDADKAVEYAHQGRSWIELPLGKGGVDFPNYLKALEEIGFRGFLAIEREVGDNPVADIELAVNFLKAQMSV